MQDCGKCLHEEVCATAKACDGHVPRCKHFMDKDGMALASCKLGAKGCFTDGKCRYSKPCDNKVVTRVDQVRAMTDEELAKALYENAECKWCKNEPECGEMLDAEKPIEDSKCIACVLSWLKQPAEEDETE